MTGKCPVCGAPFNGEACDYCGYTQKTQIMTDLNPVQTQPQQEQPQVQQPQIHLQQTIQTQTLPDNTGIIPGISQKSKTVALILCILSGCFGVHRFYVGKVGSGILYLCSFGLFGIGWLIDIVLIATGSFKDEFDLPLRQ